MIIASQQHKTLIRSRVEVPHDLMMSAYRDRAEDIKDFGIGWMSNAARDMFKIAVVMAGFDCKELTMEIIRRKGSRSGMVNCATVENSMSELCERERE